ncbi:MAG: translational machinery protein [Devosia sp.]
MSIVPNTFCYVWIDHRTAKIFTIERNAGDRLSLHGDGLPKHLHSHSDHVHQMRCPDEAFLNTVAEALAGFKGILIAGPGTARKELAGYLADRHPQIANRVWGVEAMDHPTDAQIVAAAQRYFSIEAKMHT